MDGFDHYTGLGISGRKWDAYSSGAMTAGRWGGQCCAPSNSNASMTTGGLIKTVPAAIEYIIGFAVIFNNFNYLELPGATQPPLVGIYSSGGLECGLYYNNGILQWRKSYAALIDPGGLLVDLNISPPLGLWSFWELRVKMGASGTGEIETVLDGVSLGVTSGIDTLNVGDDALITKIVLRWQQNYFAWSGWDVDDLYILDTTGSAPTNTFLGEVRVQTKIPDAEGSVIQWLPNQGTNNELNVNKVVTEYSGHEYVYPYGDVDKYNYSETVGDMDLYSIQNFTVSGTIFAIQSNISFRKDDVGSRTVIPVLKTPNGPTIYEGVTPFGCYSQFTHGSQVWVDNPDTNLPWVLVDLNQTEFGIKVQS